MANKQAPGVEDECQWVKLSQWGNRTPSHGTMRNIVSRRKDNGADVFLSMVNGCFYINIPAFNLWMTKQKEKDK
jgi:hypothetical protein